MILKYPSISKLTHRLQTAPRFTTRVCLNTCNSNILSYQNYTKYRVTVSCHRGQDLSPSSAIIAKSRELTRACSPAPSGGKRSLIDAGDNVCILMKRGLSIWSFYFCVRTFDEVSPCSFVFCG